MMRVEGGSGVLVFLETGLRPVKFIKKYKVVLDGK